MSTLRKLPTALVAVLAAGALVACGGEDSSSGSPADVAKEFSIAVANGDGEAACGLVSESLTGPIEDQGQDCESVIGDLGNFLTDEERSNIEDATYETSSEDGENATVEVDLGDETDTMELVMEDGEWKVAEPAD